MRTHKLRLKPEQRILAMEIVNMRGHHRYLLGIVYRGSRWLDGIIFAPLGRKRVSGIARVVKTSPYYKELRYILFRDPRNIIINGEPLQIALQLPVIEIRNAKGKRVLTREWGITRENAEAIMKAFTVRGNLPEALSTVGYIKSALEELAV